MIELPFVFLAGVLGSAHCVGMCGGFVVSIGTRTDRLAENLVRQSLYSVGRIFTYGTLGAAVAFGGYRLMQWNSQIPSLLAIAAGLFLIVQGLFTTGVLRRRYLRSKSVCLAGSFFSALFRGNGRTQAFLAGVMTGFLPCGLLYGMLAGAASTSNLVSGAVLMMAFGLGTVPVMMLTGSSGTVLSHVARKRLFWVAGWCVVATGVITLSRGVYAFAPGADVAPCPFCP